MIGGAPILEDIRITKLTKIDEKLTRELNIGELKVIYCEDTIPRTFLVIDSDCSPAGNPDDGSTGEPHQYYGKHYLDYIETKSGIEYVILDHRFIKYVQRREDSQGNIRYRKFSKGYDFAEKDAKITKRLEKRIVLLAMISSCLDAAAQLDGLISRQTVGSIVKKWVHKCDVLRNRFITPRQMAIVSGTDSEHGYVFFMDVQISRISIIDVITGISSEGILKELQKFELEKVQYLITDSNAIIVDTLRGAISTRDTMLAVEPESIVQIINDRIIDYMNKNERQIPVETKADILVDKDLLEDNRKERVDLALDIRPELRKIYEHVNLLRRIIKIFNGEEYRDFNRWIDQIPEESEEIFDDASVYVENYEEEIINFYRRRKNISGSLTVRIRNLVDKLSRWSEKAPELMRARLLYASIVNDYEDLEENQWKGLTYEDVIDNIEMLINEGGKL